MRDRPLRTWQEIESEVRRRIRERVWPPGSTIPTEAALADEFGCARATVNRALQAVADSGLLDRKRKAGTRVTRHPVRKATFSIPLIRQEIEERGVTYSHQLLTSEVKPPPTSIRLALRLDGGVDALHLEALHMAGNDPYLFEDRWINMKTVPDILQADLARTNANEWLVTHAPFTHAEIAVLAYPAGTKIAGHLRADPGAALLALERQTFDQERTITWVRLTFHPGYRLETRL